MYTGVIREGKMEFLGNSNVPAFGRVILLNGASSSGKTTLAMVLQNRLAIPHFHLNIDDFIRTLPAHVRLNPAAFEQYLPRIIAGFHSSAAALANTGNSIIIDHVLERPEWLKDCLDTFRNIEVVFVGLRCSLQELVRRELARQNRDVGIAKYHYQRVHAHEVYDLELETTNRTPEECAKAVIDYLDSNSTPTAFSRLRQMRIGVNDRWNTALVDWPPDELYSIVDGEER
jgi:chloramphenicol 3-O phosphotransferase